MQMTMIFICVTFFGADSTWTFSDSEIYETLRISQITVNDQGETFIIDAQECQILKLNGLGVLVKRFGKKGQGPGEFSFPDNLQSFADHIYLVDHMASNLLCFDSNGEFIAQWKIKSFPRDLTKTMKGWAYGTWGSTQAGSKMGTLTWVDDAWGTPKVWFDFAEGKAKPKKDESGGFTLEVKNGFATMPHNPARDAPRIAVLPGGRYLALTNPGTQMKVDIYDTISGKVINALQQRSQPIPFNKDWAQKRLEKMNKATEERPSSGAFKVKFTADFPEYFPYVREFWAYGDGRFYLQAWSGQPDRDKTIISFTEKGDIKETELVPSVTKRLLHLNATHGWVTLFDEDEEQAGVAKVLRSDLADFVKANPIIETESSGVIIMGN